MPLNSENTGLADKGKPGHRGFGSKWYGRAQEFVRAKGAREAHPEDWKKTVHADSAVDDARTGAPRGTRCQCWRRGSVRRSGAAAGHVPPPRLVSPRLASSISRAGWVRRRDGTRAEEAVSQRSGGQSEAGTNDSPRDAVAVQTEPVERPARDAGRRAREERVRRLGSGRSG